MPTCELEHRYDAFLADLPNEQGGSGRHKCAGCAYDKGYSDGYNRRETLNLDISSLDDSQAGTGRHKSPHAAYALGYLDGVKNYFIDNQ